MLDLFDGVAALRLWDNLPAFPLQFVGHNRYLQAKGHHYELRTFHRIGPHDLRWLPQDWAGARLIT